MTANISCKDLDALLAEGDEVSLHAAARHAEGCAACRALLDDFDDISATARSMRVTWPSDTLWPRIERALAAQPQPRRHSPVWQIAAAVLLLVALGAAALVAERRSRDDAFNRVILQRAAVEEVERTERDHLAAIDRLEKLAEPGLQSAQSPLMVRYKEKLMLLDDAIAECEAGVRINRQNAQLRRQLLSVYSEKQRTLQDILREESHESR
jgi:pimeloyl-ACP methyl ester carboxylesterase